jgi:hypothetical protein
MNLTRRRGAIATFITLGVLLTGLAIFLSIPWIMANKEHVALMVLGVVFFAALVAGVVLNTIFLVREVRRNDRQDNFLNAVTHELKTAPWTKNSGASFTRSCARIPTASWLPSSRSSRRANSASGLASRTAHSSTLPRWFRSASTSRSRGII